MSKSAVALAISLPVLLFIGLGFYALPTASGPGETLEAYSRLGMHLLGITPKMRTVSYGKEPPMPRLSNGSIREIQGFVKPEVFRSQYLWKEPVVFRKAATKENGWDLECLTDTGKSVEDALAEELDDRKIQIFMDQYDDGSVDEVTITEYERLAKKARLNKSLPMPYGRAFPQNSMRKCRPVDNDNLKPYRSVAGRLYQNHIPMNDLSLLFVSYNNETNTKMHIDVSDSFFTQVYGRKKWLFVDPEYVTNMQVYGDNMNLVYYAGFDVHREPLPAEVPLKEIILHPGDVVYFPSMTFHAVYNLDPVTIGVDNLAFDLAGSFLRHWMLTLCTLLNPWTVVEAIRIFWEKKSLTANDIYFSRFSLNKRGKKLGEL